MKLDRPFYSSLVVIALSTTAICSAAAAPPIVRVYVAGSADAVSGSRAALQDLCAHENVAIVVRDAASADEALLAQSPAPGLAEAYIDLRPGSTPRVVVVDSETRKDLERRVLPEDTSLEIAIETAAHVVCTAVESTLATRAAVASPQAAPTPMKPTAIAAREPAPEQVEPKSRFVTGSRWSSQLDLFAAATNFGAGFCAGGGAALGVSHGNGALDVGALLSVAGYPATDIEAAGGVASFGMFGARLLPTIGWQATQSLTAFVGIGGGADRLRVTARRAPPGAVEQPATSAFEVMASARFAVRFRLNSGVALLLGLDADADLVRHHYVIDTPQGRQSFFEPARVRPLAFAGLSLSLPSHESRATAPREAQQ